MTWSITRELTVSSRGKGAFYGQRGHITLIPGSSKQVEEVVVQIPVDNLRHEALPCWLGSYLLADCLVGVQSVDGELYEYWP